MTPSIKNQLVAVTGAASGIGRATCELLAQNGGLLSLADKDGDALKKIARKLTDQGASVLWKQVDVRNKNEVEEWALDTVKHFNRPLDGAVNLAGVIGHTGTVRDHDSANYESIFNCNVEGVFNCCSAELRHMRVAKGDIGGGAIVNAASVAGLVGKAGFSIYCASKFAVVGITKAAAREESESGIRINAIAPGFIQTPMVERLDAELGLQLPNNAVLGRRGKPEEVAKLIQFLLSEESSYITGSVYQIDGGMLC